MATHFVSLRIGLGQAGAAYIEMGVNIVSVILDQSQKATAAAMQITDK
jgi:hypothetical protein